MDTASPKTVVTVNDLYTDVGAIGAIRTSIFGSAWTIENALLGTAPEPDVTAPDPVNGGYVAGMHAELVHVGSLLADVRDRLRRATDLFPPPATPLSATADAAAAVTGAAEQPQQQAA